MAFKQRHKIAFYIRVSTEEQASNPEGSIKSQEQRLRSHVQYKINEGFLGDIVHVYIDRARSGKDTNRPELQKLLKAVKNKDVTLVMVTELSRLSRSLKDFCSIWEMMRSMGCEFQSLREQFDTTSAAGEMVLYTVANIAQFERRQVSERVSANFLARAQRGLFNGGSIPLGYKLDPDRKGYLVEDKENSKIVREAFKTFLREKTLAATGKSLNERGFVMPKKRHGGGAKQRLGHFTPDNLHQMLHRRIYLGEKVFKVGEETKIVKACWPPIVDELTFKKVGDLLKKNDHRRKTKGGNRWPYLLSTTTVCGLCGDRLPGKSAHGNGGGRLL